MRTVAAILLLLTWAAAAAQPSGVTTQAAEPPPPVVVSLSPPPSGPSQPVEADAGPAPGYVNSPSPPPAVIALPVNPPPPTVILALPPGGMVRGMGGIEPPRANLPQPQRPRILRVPQAWQPAQQYVRLEDYPPAALAMRAQGRVRVALEIGVNGRVASCLVVESSGYAVLDSATCRLIRSRGRFTPARDSTGSPVSAQVEDSVEWVLPPSH